MGLFTNKAMSFPSIQIHPTADDTQTPKTSLRGFIGGVAILSLGNPKQPIKMTNSSMELKTIVISDGGALTNEQAYHIKEFLDNGGGGLFLARALGNTSTINTIKFTKGTKNTLEKTSSKINIWGSNNIDDWNETTKTEAIEILIKLAPTEKITVSLSNKEDILTLKIFNSKKELIYQVRGNAKIDSKDDLGNSNYIGNVADSNYLAIKVDSKNSSYVKSFDEISADFSDITTEKGTVNKDSLKKVLLVVAEDLEYLGTLGLYDTYVRDTLKEVATTKNLDVIFDIKGNTIADAITDKTSVGYNKNNAVFLWERSKQVTKNGTFKIGLGGAFLGFKVYQDLLKQEKGTLNKVSAIAGEDFPLSGIRNYAHNVDFLEDDDKTTLHDNRIITIGRFGDKVGFNDVTSGESKEISTSQYSVAMGANYIKREIAKIISQKIFKTFKEAIPYIKNHTKTLFENCNTLGYFDVDVEIDKRYKIEVEKSKEANDKIVVKVYYVPNTIMTRGEVFLSITKEINKG